MGLDEKSIEAIRKWIFEPGRQGGTPVAVEMNVTVSFSLGPDAKTQELLERAQLEAPPRPPVITSVEPCSPSPVLHEPRAFGATTRVSELRFDGALQLPVADQEEIASSIKRRTYEGTPDEVKSDVLERVKAAWGNRGYFKAEVSGEAKVLTSSDAEDRLAFAIYVGEGKQYRLREITFKNNTVFRDASLLRNLFLLKDGDLFDRDKISQGLGALYKAYAEAGYINFTSIPDTKFNDENNLVDLEINLDEGKLFFISGIKIVGSDQPVTRDALKDLPPFKNVQFKNGVAQNIPRVDLDEQTASMLRASNEYVARCTTLAKQFGCTFMEWSDGAVSFLKVPEKSRRHGKPKPKAPPGRRVKAKKLRAP